MIIKTPKPPYIAVIFTSLKTKEAKNDYDLMNELTSLESGKIEGYLGCESLRNEHEWGITISYWKNIEAVNTWRKNTIHQQAKNKGRAQWYTQYAVRITEVKEDHLFL